MDLKCFTEGRPGQKHSMNQGMELGESRNNYWGSGRVQLEKASGDTMETLERWAGMHDAHKLGWEPTRVSTARSSCVWNLRESSGGQAPVQAGKPGSTSLLPSLPRQPSLIAPVPPW